MKRIASSTQKGPVRRIESHIAMRGFAALLVIGYHLQFGAGYRLPFERASEFFHRSYLFVDLFFVLSGFIISYVNDAERAKPFAKAEIGTFLRARFARLYPLHLFCLCYLVVFRLLSSGLYALAGASTPAIWNHYALASLASQLVLLNAYLPGPSGWNIPSWSISAEICAYMAFPLLVMARTYKPQLLEVLLLVIPAAFCAAVLRYEPNLDITTGFGWARCLAGFALGMLAFYNRRIFAALSATQLSLLQVAATAAAGLILGLALPDILVLPAFVAIVAATWTDSGILPILLRKGPWIWMGEISYSIYLNHVPMIAILGFGWSHLHVAQRLSPEFGRACWIVIVYGTTLAVSHLTFNFVERPARQWLSRRWSHRAAPPIETSPAGP